MSQKLNSFTKLVPGIALATGVGIVAIMVNNFYAPLSAVAVAMVFGLVIRNTVSVPEICLPGIKFSVKRLLRLAIILLGVRLSFTEVLVTGGRALGIIVACIVITLILVAFLAHKFGLPRRLGTLIGVGTCICGNSAIMATAPVIEAEDEEVSFAVATITLFGVLAVFAYPLLGHFLTMSDSAFGVWSGTAINDTSQVVTAGFIYSDDAGNIATVVKMTRNLFMAPVIVLMGILYSRRNSDDETKCKIDWKKAFPLFVLGFVVMAILRTLGVFPTEVVDFLKTAASFLIVVAIAGAGMGTSIAAMRKTGLRPFYVGLAASIVMGVVSFSLINVFLTG